MTATAFYCASSALYFPGAVAMINGATGIGGSPNPGDSGSLSHIWAP